MKWVLWSGCSWLSHLKEQVLSETSRPYILQDFQIAIGYAGGQRFFMLRGNSILSLGFTFHRTSAHDSWIILVLRLPFALGLRKQYSKQQKQNPGCFSVWELSEALRRPWKSIRKPFFRSRIYVLTPGPLKVILRVSFPARENVLETETRHPPGTTDASEWYSPPVQSLPLRARGQHPVLFFR